MKSTGITRRLDGLGRIVLPKELRKQLRWEEKDALEIYVNGDDVVLRKYEGENDVQNAHNALVMLVEQIEDEQQLALLNEIRKGLRR